MPEIIPNEPYEPSDREMSELNDNHGNPTYAAALVALGQILLQKESPTRWMTISQLCAQCRKHKRKLPPLEYTIKAMKNWIYEYFYTCEDIRAPGIEVVSRFVDRPKEPEQQIQFQTPCT